MTKPIIATTFSGLYIKSDPWKKAHILWFQKASKELNDPLINDWAYKEDYFKGVDEVMKRLYPTLSDSQRTKEARNSFFNSVCQYIQQNTRVRNNEVIEFFKELKAKYELALITTNTEEAINRILKILNLEELFDFIEPSRPDEKDDKTLVFDRFIRIYGKPFIYIGGDRKDSFDYCKQHNIRAIFANFEDKEDIFGVESVHNLKELELKLK
ncbi:HAD hydrolase-like protein [Candidatus Woesearchaeota archaeon]|nr:HAD hydrolase-like protein [Candidatus Woesearchaeota archaeon]